MKTRTAFDRWFQQVDLEVQSLAGVSVTDLADFCSRDLFEDGVSPEEAARDALHEDDLGRAFGW